MRVCNCSLPAMYGFSVCKGCTKGSDYWNTEDWGSTVTMPHLGLWQEKVDKETYEDIIEDLRGDVRTLELDKRTLEYDKALLELEVKVLKEIIDGRMGCVAERQECESGKCKTSRGTKYGPITVETSSSYMENVEGRESKTNRKRSNKA